MENKNEQNQQHHHHHHHHHRRDGASRFKERSLRAIVIRRRLGIAMKILLTIVAIGMICGVVFLYKFV